jgi:D-glycero-alpha-D-manno-heptose-7-phosphate kinase
MKRSVSYRSKAPLRISFAGGGTDVSPFADEYGGAVLNATISMFAYATLQVRDDRRYTMVNLDDGVHAAGELHSQIDHGGGLTLATAVIRHLKVDRGFDLVLHSDAPWGSGLGSSSTHVVAVVGAFAHWLQLPLSSYDIAELSYEVERKDMGQEGGRQDQYSAAFGGFNFTEFTSSGVLVHPLRIKDDFVNELHYRSLLCSVGRTRNSAAILRDQVDRYRSGEATSVTSLHETKALAYDMKNALLRGQLEDMAALLHQGWSLKKQVSPLVSNPEIDDVYEGALANGAVGGRLLGAGGGGHMLFMCPDGAKHHLASYLQKRGVPIVPFSFEKRGLTQWSTTDDA